MFQIVPYVQDNNLNILYQGPIHISEGEVREAIGLKCPGSDALIYLLEQ